MENTGKLLFGDDAVPQWYIAAEGSWLGPMKAEDVYQKVVAGQASWATLVWKPGQAGWTPICDTPTFQVVIPQLPGAQGDSGPKPGVRKAAPPEVRKKAAATPPPPAPVEEDPKEWYLYINQGQYGPFSLSEVKGMVKSAKVQSSNFVWKHGMPDWQKIEKVAELLDAPIAGKPPAPGAKPVPLRPVPKPKADERRTAPRKPIVAKIMMAHEDSVVVGLCRDISMGGMQVLTDRIPGKPGSKLKLNISPSGGRKLKPFVAEGIMVRVLEDGRGFSFRFERVSEKDRKSIQEFIDAS